MRKRSLDLLLMCAATILGAMLVVAAVPLPVLRVPLTLPILFFFPGYALLEAANPRGGLGVVEKMLLGLGLSLSLLALGGLVLDLLPWGLQGATWMLYLCPIIFGGSLVAWLRRPSSMPPSERWRLSISGPQAICLSLSLLVVAGAMALAVAGAASARGTVPTQFWLLPADTASTPSVQLGLRNAEPQTITYRIDLEIDGRTVYQGDPITLEPQEMANPRLELPEEQARQERIEIKLYRMDDQETAYRRLTYWRGR